MTHAESIHRAVLEVATELPGFFNLRPEIQQSLLELGEKYFNEEFHPRLEGMINVPRYQVAIAEKSDADRIFMEEQIEFLSMCVMKAQKAAHEQLAETYGELMSRKRGL